MAYPEPTPALKGKKAEEFHKKLKEFKLSERQKELYEDAAEFSERKLPRSSSKSQTK